MSNLLPCHKCGGIPYVFESSATGYEWKIACYAVGCDFEPVYYGGQYGVTREEAEDEWNGRHDAGVGDGMGTDIPLLPCPACGCMELAEDSCGETTWIECARCFMRGPSIARVSRGSRYMPEDLWNAMTRRPVWTNVQPRVNGWYFVRTLSEDGEWHVRGMLYVNDVSKLARQKNRHWAGPIPFPTEVHK